MDFGEHISQRYDEELENLRNRVMHMAGLVESQANKAVQSLLERNETLAAEVIEGDDVINRLEMEIDEEGTHIIARRQPTASDLRLVMTLIKAITDLERIGDEAQQIALYSEKLATKKSNLGMHSELTHLCQLSLSVLKESLDAFARLDDAQSINILVKSTQVQKEVDKLSRLLITYMMEDSRNIKSSLRVSWCARSLERIADHAFNISEYNIYLVKGADVRHTSLKHIREKYFPADTEEE